MPFFNSRPKKHIENAKPEAKIAVFSAQMRPSKDLEIVAKEISRSSLHGPPNPIVNPVAISPKHSPISELKICSFFDIPE